MDGSKERKIDYSKFSEKVIIFEIFKDTNDLYLREALCNEFNVGNKNDIKEIRKRKCYKISEEDVNKIENIVTKEGTHFHPKYVPIMNIDKKILINVYTDNVNKKLYILKNICNDYNIYNNDEIIIDNNVYINTTIEQIEEIEEKALNKGIVIKRTYKELNEDNNKKLFEYYNDVELNKLYITRELLEETRKYKIEIEGTPRIIDNKNCYSINVNELAEIEIITNKMGIEKIINKKKKNIETRIVYNDKRNNKLYIPEEYATNKNTNKKTILNKVCYEATIKELENIYNTKIYIVNVYTKIDNKETIIICNYNGRLFVLKDILSKLKIAPIKDIAIKVSNDIYQEINEDILRTIQSNESDNYNIEMKQIIPLKK